MVTDSGPVAIAAQVTKNLVIPLLEYVQDQNHEGDNPYQRKERLTSRVVWSAWYLISW
jgi:hypothetical protein